MIRQVYFLSAYAPSDKYSLHVFKLCQRLYSNTKSSCPLTNYQLKIVDELQTPKETVDFQIFPAKKIRFYPARNLFVWSGRRRQDYADGFVL